MSDQPDEYDKEMPPKQGPEAAAKENFAGGGNLVTMYQAQQGANTESFPVLQAFQEYIEAERKQARKRIMQLSISFAVIIGVVVMGFLAAGVYMMQDTTKRLFQMAEKNSAPMPVTAPAPVPMQTASAVAQTSPALEESIRQMSLVLAKMQSENVRPPAVAAPDKGTQNTISAQNPELDALKAELLAMKEQSRKLEDALSLIHQQEGVPAQTEPVIKPLPRYSVEDALAIARKTGAEKAATDKAAADKIAQAKEDAEKAKLDQVEMTKKAALEIAAISATAEREAQLKRTEAEQPAPVQAVAVNPEALPDARLPVADKLPPTTPQGVVAPMPPKEMMVVSLPLKTKTGGVVPWRVLVPE